MTSAAAVEYAWTVTAFAGLIVQTVLTFAALRDLRVVYRFGPEVNGHKRAVAWGSLELGVGLILVHGCFVTLGVQALARPNVPLEWTAARLTPIGLFMAASVILVVVGLNEARIRHKVNQPTGG